MNRTSASGITSDPTWPPEVAQREPRQPLGPAVTIQAGDGLVGVEVDAPSLLAHDPPQQLGQDRVPGRGGQAGAARSPRRRVPRRPCERVRDGALGRSACTGWAAWRGPGR